MPPGTGLGIGAFFTGLAQGFGQSLQQRHERARKEEDARRSMASEMVRWRIESINKNSGLTDSQKTALIADEMQKMSQIYEPQGGRGKGKGQGQGKGKGGGFFDRLLHPEKGEWTPPPGLFNIPTPPPRQVVTPPGYIDVGPSQQTPPPVTVEGKEGRPPETYSPIPLPKTSTTLGEAPRMEETEHERDVRESREDFIAKTKAAAELDRQKAAEADARQAEKEKFTHEENVRKSDDITNRIRLRFGLAAQAEVRKRAYAKNPSNPDDPVARDLAAQEITYEYTKKREELEQKVRNLTLAGDKKVIDLKWEDALDQAKINYFLSNVTDKLAKQNQARFRGEVEGIRAQLKILEDSEQGLKIKALTGDKDAQTKLNAIQIQREELDKKLYDAVDRAASYTPPQDGSTTKQPSKGRVSRSNFLKNNPSFKGKTQAEIDAAITSAGYTPYGP